MPISLRPEIRYFLLLAAAFAGCFGLLTFRMVISGSSYHLFLAWNLFLAAIPLGLSLLTVMATRGQPVFLTMPLLVGLSVVWLVFFPNSPYIFTDFIHLIQKQLDDPNARGMKSMLIWYDVVLNSVFAFSGHLAGLISLHTMHRLWRKFFGRFWGWLLVFVSALAAGYGVFIGRFIRLNSWNLVTKPEKVIREVFDNVLADDALFFTLAFGGFILISYFFIYVFKRYSGGR